MNEILILALKFLILDFCTKIKIFEIGPKLDFGAKIDQNQSNQRSKLTAKGVKIRVKGVKIRVKWIKINAKLIKKNKAKLTINVF